MKMISRMLLIASLGSGVWAAHKTVDCMHAATDLMNDPIAYVKSHR